MKYERLNQRRARAKTRDFVAVLRARQNVVETWSRDQQSGEASIYTEVGAAEASQRRLEQLDTTSLLVCRTLEHSRMIDGISAPRGRLWRKHAEAKERLKHDNRPSMADVMATPDSAVELCKAETSDELHATATITVGPGIVKPADISEATWRRFREHVSGIQAAALARNGIERIVETSYV